MGQGSVQVAVYQDGGAWIAQCLDYDICAQAPDLETLQQRFDAVMSADFTESMNRTGKPFGGIGPAPEFARAKFVQAKEQGFRSNGPVRKAGENTPAYEMALCA